MRKALAVVLFLLLGAFLSIAGFAVHEAEARPKEQGQQYQFRSGIEVGPSSANTAVVARITYATVDWDFPALGGTLAAADTVCAVSRSVTVTGARYGDACWVGMDQVPTSNFATFSAQVTAADTAVVRECAPLSDGGTANQPDSGFTIYCLGR